jgi:hypothetical protein
MIAACTTFEFALVVRFFAALARWYGGSSRGRVSSKWLAGATIQCVSPPV